ncbi:MAG: SRPBCC domain-containing protein [Nocardioidaceae bacterium]
MNSAHRQAVDGPKHVACIASGIAEMAKTDEPLTLHVMGDGTRALRRARFIVCGIGRAGQLHTKVASRFTLMSHTDVGRAVIGAPPAAVFAALVDVGARTVWLPPGGMSGRFDWFDARPGGGYHLILTYDDPATRGKSANNVDVVEVRFTIVEEPRRLVEEADFVSDDPTLAGTMTMTWSLEDVDPGTLVTITATDVPDGISSTDHVAAFESTLSNLDRYLQDRSAS